MDTATLRTDIARIGHRLYERGLTVALDGNVSARTDDGRMLCTRSGCHKGRIAPGDVLVLTRGGDLLDGDGVPTSELPLHLACYDERPEIRAVVHAHPPAAIACTLVGVDLARPVLPEMVLDLGAVPTVAYRTTGTRALAELVRPVVRDHDAFLLARHGAVTVGRTLDEAFDRMETVEHTARILLLAASAGHPTPLDPDEVARLRALGRARYGGSPTR